jgi:hypothetical protein
MCPHCGKNAPIVHRGLTAYCTACGRPRPPLSGKAVDLAGKPSQVGGVVAGVLGWMVLLGGGFVALLLALLLAWIFPASLAPWAVGLPIGLLSFTVGLLLLLGGRKLRKSGTEAERAARTQALFSFAANRGGVITARDAASALDMPAEDADALLTELAKTRSDEVGVEIGERGEILYVFPGIAGTPRARFPAPGVRIDAGAAGGSRAAEAEAEAEDEAAAGPRRREQAR